MDPAFRLPDDRAQLCGPAIGTGEKDRTWSDAQRGWLTVSTANSRNRSPMFGPFATPVAERPLAARAGCPWPAFSLAGDSPLEGAGRLPTGKARSIATARPDACANARSPGPRPRAFLRPTGARCSRPTPRPSPAHSGLPDRRSRLREGGRGQGVLWEPHPEQLPDRSCQRPGCRVERGRPSFAVEG